MNKERCAALWDKPGI